MKARAILSICFLLLVQLAHARRHPRGRGHVWTEIDRYLFAGGIALFFIGFIIFNIYETRKNKNKKPPGLNR
jgi:hypothetical protein